MDKINDVLRSIFEVNNFTQHSISEFNIDIEFYTPKQLPENITNNDYYLIAYIPDRKNLANFLDEQQRIYEYILKNFSSYEHLRKNITAILCLDTDMQFIRDKNSLTHLTLQEIEEDPYYFRKIVLTYNNNQLKAYSEKFLTT